MNLQDHNTNARPKILILAFSNLKHDARISRQVEWLRHEYDLHVVCFDAEDITGVHFIRIKQTKLTLSKKVVLSLLLFFRQFKPAYRTLHDYEHIVAPLQNQTFQWIVANDIDTLPLAFSIKGGANETKILFDAHEYAPRHFEDKLVWRIFFQPLYIHLCKKYIPLTNEMLTVSQGLAREYEKNFHKRPILITNAPPFRELSPSKVSPDHIRIIHHGTANKSRKLELMIEMMDFLDQRFSLDLILMTSDYASASTKSYIEDLKVKASKNDRIKILPPVKSFEVVDTINQYDIGIFLLPPINFNYANTLPNKFFDFIQARLAIAIGPTPEMAQITQQFNLGVISEDFTAQSLAKKINALSATDISQFKSNTNSAAEAHNAESNKSKLIKVLQATSS